MVAAFALAQIADGVSAVVAALTDPAFREMNLLPGALLVRPEWALVVKLLAIVLVVSICVILNRRRVWLSRALLGLGIVAGVVGTISNLPR